MAEALAAVSTALRGVAPLVLLWLAFFFGRSLRGGDALIERIALRSRPDLPAPLRRHARRLTALWCGYFVCAAGLAAAANWLQWLPPGPVPFVVLGGTVLLFVGEHALRPRWFPGEAFPGLLQQLRDTASVWRAPR